MSTDSTLKNSLRDQRSRRGWSQQQLADRAGIARASVSAIEIERLVPSTAAALALAAAFECQVEDLFQLPGRGKDAPTWAWPLKAARGRYWQADVGGRTLLYPYEATQLGTIPHDGVAADGTSLEPHIAAPPTLVMACCDPAVALMSAELARTSGLRLLPFYRSSRQALSLLKQGLVHVAGLHLGHANGEGNSAAAKADLGAGYRLIRVARWEEGVATTAARGSSIRSLMKSKVRWVGREPGSGARQCLDEVLGSRPAPRRTARDHRGVADAIRNGWADAGVCLRLTADEANLQFFSVRHEAYDLCYAANMETDSRIRALIGVLRSSAYRQSLDDLPGYKSTGIGAAMPVD